MNIGWGDQPPVTTLSIHLHSLGLQLVTWGVDAVVTPGAGYYSKVRARTLNRREAGAAPRPRMEAQTERVTRTDAWHVRTVERWPQKREADTGRPRGP